MKKKRATTIILLSSDQDCLDRIRKLLEPRHSNPSTIYLIREGLFAYERELTNEKRSN
jgi:hypothetical protein